MSGYTVINWVSEYEYQILANFKCMDQKMDILRKIEDELDMNINDLQLEIVKNNLNIFCGGYLGV